MGGRVLELYSERLRREERAEGRAEGRKLGRAEERAKMESILVHVKDEGRAEVVRQLCASGLLTPEQIAGAVGMTPEEVRAL